MANVPEREPARPSTPAPGYFLRGRGEGLGRAGARGSRACAVRGPKGRHRPLRGLVGIILVLLAATQTAQGLACRRCSFTPVPGFPSPARGGSGPHSSFNAWSRSACRATQPCATGAFHIRGFNAPLPAFSPRRTRTPDFEPWPSNALGSRPSAPWRAMLSPSTRWCALQVTTTVSTQVPRVENTQLSPCLSPGEASPRPPPTYVAPQAKREPIAAGRGNVTHEKNTREVTMKRVAGGGSLARGIRWG